MIPRARRDLPQAAGIELRVEFFAGPGHDDDLVLGVAADVGEAITQLLVGTGTPLEGPAVGMKRNLENAVTPFHADVFILVGVVFKLDHSDPSFRRGLKHPQRRFTRGSSRPALKRQAYRTKEAEAPWNTFFARGMS